MKGKYHYAEEYYRFPPEHDRLLLHSAVQPFYHKREMACFTHTIDGVTLDLAHLEPRTLILSSQKLSRELQIKIRFSNHCFTCKFKDGLHAASQLIMDHKQRRAYDAERHHLSFRLPGIVDNLPSAAVHLTPTDRNYVYIANIAMEDGRQYPMYFNLRRASQKHSADLLMFVESAYPVADRRQVLAGTTKISFPILCAKIYRGEVIRPQARR